MNRYQLRKAKQIAASLQRAADRTMEATSPNMLAKCVALLSFDQWRTICFTAGVPVADLDTKAAVLCILRSRSIHKLG